MKHTLILTFLFATLFAGSCTKDETTSNELDSTSGIFTCQINGSPWKSYKDFSIAMYQNNSRFDIIGKHHNATDSSGIVLSLILTPEVVGVYNNSNSDSTNPHRVYYYPDLKPQTQLEILTKYTTTYSVNFTKFDKQNAKVSGTFTITQTAPAVSSKPSFVITNGVFKDVRLIL